MQQILALFIGQVREKVEIRRPRVCLVVHFRITSCDNYSASVLRVYEWDQELVEEFSIAPVIQNYQVPLLHQRFMKHLTQLLLVLVLQVFWRISDCCLLQYVHQEALLPVGLRPGARDMKPSATVKVLLDFRHVEDTSHHCGLATVLFANHRDHPKVGLAISQPAHKHLYMSATALDLGLHPLPRIFSIPFAGWCELAG